MDILILTNHHTIETRARILITLISGWVTTIAIIFLHTTNQNPLLTIITTGWAWLLIQALLSFVYTEPFDFPCHLIHVIRTSKQFRRFNSIPLSKTTAPNAALPLRLTLPDNQPPILSTHHLRPTPPTGPPVGA